MNPVTVRSSRDRTQGRRTKEGSLAPRGSKSARAPWRLARAAWTETERNWPRSGMATALDTRGEPPYEGKVGRHPRSLRPSLTTEASKMNFSRALKHSETRILCAALLSFVAACSSSSTATNTGGNGTPEGGTPEGSTPEGAAPQEMGPAPSADFLPAPTGTCPEFTEGMITVSPSGITHRNVQLLPDHDAAPGKEAPSHLCW